MTPRKPSVSDDDELHSPPGPMRTCVGCRKRESRSVLVRLIVTDGNVVIDERRSTPGRGAWVHPNPACLTRAVAGRTIGRALRAPEVDVSGLAESRGAPPEPTLRTGREPDGHSMSTSK